MNKMEVMNNHNLCIFRSIRVPFPLGHSIAFDLLFWLGGAVLVFLKAFPILIGLIPETMKLI